MEPRKTMFGPPKHKKYADIITFKSENDARIAARQMHVEFNKANTRPKRVIIIKALNLASNRAKASAKRENISSTTKRRLLAISKIYKDMQEKLSELNNSCF